MERELRSINDVELLMASPATHNFVKDIIRQGRRLDCVDAYYDALTAAQALKAIMDAGPRQQ